MWGLTFPLSGAFNDFWERANPAVVRAQPDRGADLEATDGDLGGTALHVAATAASDPDAVAALLEAGADIEAIDDEGRTACGIARMTRRD